MTDVLAGSGSKPQPKTESLTLLGKALVFLGENQAIVSSILWAVVVVLIALNSNDLFKFSADVVPGITAATVRSGVSTSLLETSGYGIAARGITMLTWMLDWRMLRLLSVIIAVVLMMSGAVMSSFGDETALARESIRGLFVILSGFLLVMGAMPLLAGITAVIFGS